MKILNIMLSKKLGGIEQVFLDYHDALSLGDIQVLSVCNTKFPKRRDEFVQINNLGWWDFIAVFKLKKIIKQYKPDYIIAHGSRAVVLSNKAKIPGTKLIGVAHNYWYKKLLKHCDIIFTITQDLKQFYLNKGFSKSDIHHIPNMIDVARFSYKHTILSNPLKIKSMGRFVEKKGFEVMIKAAKILHEKNINFIMHIGGGGELEKFYQNLINEMNLNNYVKLIGWVDDKDKFFEDADVFVLPSHSEPFGVVILEAFLRSRLVLSTKSEGPSEIITHNKTGILVNLADYEAIADEILKIVNNKTDVNAITKNAFETVQEYSFESFVNKVRKNIN